MSLDAWDDLLREAKGKWDRTLDEIRPRRVPPETQLQRYVRQHRADPDAGRAFVARNMPEGADLEKEWRRYVSAMEDLLREG